MDFDPCAASRIQIVTQTSDLTAFELAGGNLGEHTKLVSTVSSNSMEHARKIAKEEAIKQMRDEITNRVRCDICDVVCYGKEYIKRHYEETKHLENVQKLSVAMKEKMSPPVANAKLQEKCEKNVQDLLLNEEPVNSFFVCSIPDWETFRNRSIVTKHLNGEKANETLNKPTTVYIVPADSPPSASSSVYAPQTVKDVVATRNVSEKVNFIICKVCNVTCNSQKSLKEHMEGKTHLKKTQKLLKLSSAIKQETPSSVEKVTKQDSLPKERTVNPLFTCDIPDLETYLNQNKHREMPLFDGTLKGREELYVRQPTWCDICKVSYCCYKCFGKHILEKHQFDNLQNTIYIAKRSSQNPIIKEGDKGKRKATTSLASNYDDLNTKRQKAMKEEVGSDVRVTCSLCQVTCNSIMGFNSHLASFEHSALVSKELNC